MGVTYTGEPEAGEVREGMAVFSEIFLSNAKTQPP
jgi:hypothetical protein